MEAEEKLSCAEMLDTAQLCAHADLLKVISRLWGAAIDAASVRIDSGVATCPTQEERGAQGEDNCLGVEFGLNANAFRGWGKGK
jgi:hypothetical protein